MRYLCFAVFAVLVCACAEAGPSKPNSLNWQELESDAQLPSGELRSAIQNDVRSGECGSVQSWIDYAEARGRLSRASGRNVGWSPVMNFIDGTLREIGCYDAQGNLLERATGSYLTWVVD